MSRVWSRRWRILAENLFAAFAVGVLVKAFAFPAAPVRPNVLLITLDTTRADHLSSYGYFRSTTPRLDGLARRSIVFEDAWAPMATTLPSHLSMMTARWPLEHGVLANVEQGGQRLRPTSALVPAAELFTRAGWNTAAFVSATPVKQGSGIERGFAVFDEDHRAVRHARQTTDAALEWLRHNGSAPFFAWVHYYDPHGPFDPPPKYRSLFSPDEPALGRWLTDRAIGDRAFRPGGAELAPREAHDGYDGELRYVDDQVARLTDLLVRRGWADRTVIAVVGDHGEGLGQHGVAGHGHVWSEQLRVPMIVHVPWLAEQRIADPVSVVDLFPTLLGQIEVPGADAWLGAVSGRDALAHRSGPSVGLSSLRQDALTGARQRSLTAGAWRYVGVDGEPGQVFELRSDPHELRGLGAALPVHREVLARWTDALVREQHARGTALGTAEPWDVPPADLDALRALGYLGD